MAEADTGAYRLRGVLGFATVPLVWPVLADKIRNHSRLRVSLQDVEQANSAALAMLLQGQQLAREQDCQLEFVDIPESLLALARMSNVAEVLQSGIGG